MSVSPQKTLNHKNVPKAKYRIRPLQKNLAFPEEACLNKNTKFCVQRPQNHAWYCLSKHTKFSVQRSWNHAWYCLSRHTKLGVQRPWNHAIVLVNMSDVPTTTESIMVLRLSIYYIFFFYILLRSFFYLRLKIIRERNWAQEPFPASVGVLFISYMKILLHEHIKFIIAET